MRNQKGISLVELLAAVTILFIVSAIIYSVYFSFNKNYEHISTKNSIDQEANLILATVKQYHQTHKEYYLKYKVANKDAFIGVSQADNRLGDDRFDTEIKIGFPNAEDIVDNTDVKINSHQPLKVYLKLTGKQGQTFVIETIVKRY